MKTFTIDQKNWISWLKAKGLSERTMKEYGSYFEKFDFDSLSQGHINKFLQSHNNNVARAFLKNLLHHIRTNEFPKELKLLAGEIEIPKITGRKKKRLPEVLSLDQIFQVSDAMNTERNKLMILVSFYGGLRISELLSIKPYDFNWSVWIKTPDQNGKLRVIGKGDKQRVVFIPQKIMSRIYQWIRSYVSRQQGKEDTLFKIRSSRWKLLLSDASKKSIGRHVNPHLLRHSCGSWLRDSGWDLKEIADYLGHESISTTTIYTHISQEKLNTKFSELVK